MKTHLKTIAAAMLFAVPGLAFAQTDPHHPAEAAATTAQAEAPSPAPAPAPEAAAPAQAQAMSPQMMQSMMQMMQNCMGMMQMMQGAMGQGMPMQGGMMQGGQNMPMMQGGGMGQNMPMMQGAMSESMSAYMAAMSKMDMPMMQGIQASDPDVAFVKGMIPHHQGAIDMAKVELQYGDDEQVKAWANQIISAQEKEIAEMQEWLKAQGE